MGSHSAKGAMRENTPIDETTEILEYLQTLQQFQPLAEKMLSDRWTTSRLAAFAATTIAAQSDTFPERARATIWFQQNAHVGIIMLGVAMAVGYEMALQDLMTERIVL